MKKLIIAAAAATMAAVAVQGASRAAYVPNRLVNRAETIALKRAYAEDGPHVLAGTAISIK